MLSPYRALDLSAGESQLAAYLLATLGADVIVVEPPDGSPTRRLGPFAQPGGESLRWWSWNRGKRSVVLDLANSEADRATLANLADSADVLIESGRPGELAAWGLGYDALSARNPALVYVSITPFGQDGPKANWAAADLTVWAAAGPLRMAGDHDRAPLALPVPQAFLHAAGDAACGALLALAERTRSGRGQHVDISAQQSAAQATQAYILSHPLGGAGLERYTAGVKAGPIEVRLIWPAADGHVSITFIFGTAVGPATGRLMEWVWEEGFCDEATRDKDWIGYGLLLASGEEPLAEYERVKRCVAAFTASKTKAELLAGARARRLLMVPVSTLEDVVESEQLAARQYWDEVDGVRAPGPAVVADRRPLLRPGRPPKVGEHTAEVLAEGPRPLDAPPPVAPDAPRELPLAGLKVLDLMWVMAGPAATRVLADNGATVVRIESATRVETARTIGPFRDDVANVEGSGLFNTMNAGKLGLTLDLSRPEAREVVAHLVRWADVVTESFAGPVLASWGLDLDTIRALNPSIIVMSSCLFGRTGPLAGFAGYGNLAAAIVGFTNLVGWPDRPPAGPAGAYTDYTAPRLALAALLAALDHRRRTGEGQYLDVAQAEAALHFITPALLDLTVNGVVWSGEGNRSLDHAPHGVYPAGPIDEDQWVAIVCEDDTQWQALAALIGRDDLARLSTAERLTRRAELDELVTAWSAPRTPQEVEAACQAARVPAHIVANSRRCFEDPQLQHRGHFLEVPHGAQGTTTVEASRIRLSATPARTEAGGPMLGEHSWEVLTTIAGYDEDRIADLAAAEALE